MATKTALQVVNQVLKNLRKPAVADFSATYSALILEYVNQSKEIIEDSHEWSALTVNLTFTTPTNQQTYDLTQAGTTPVITSDASDARFANERTRMRYDETYTPMVFDTTSASQPVQLTEYTRTSQELSGIIGLQNSTAIKPNSFSFWRNKGLTSITLWNPPPGAFNMRVSLFVPQNELVAGGDVLLVPWRPVVTLATSLAMDERGEELGPDGSRLTQKALRDLEAAMAVDSNAYQNTFTPY